jgi:hypothetical protein
LLPGEKRRITVEVPAMAAGKGDMQVSVTGWNVRDVTVPAQRTQ